MSDVVLKVATPLEFSAADPMDVPKSLKVTIPEAMPKLLLTVAVRVTFWLG